MKEKTGKNSAKMLSTLTLGILTVCVLLAITLLPSFAAAQTAGGTGFGYSQYATDIHAQTKLTQSQSKLPALTFLTHGQGCDASTWSNDANGNFICDETSLIEKIRISSGDANVYLAKAERVNTACESHECTVTCDKSFQLSLLTKGADLGGTLYGYIETPVAKIADFSRHAVVVFEATQSLMGHYGASNLGHDVVYKELHTIVDSILFDYVFVTGGIPKINMVAHSRGGITNMMYATEHPYNVDAMYSMGTPYVGSTLGKIEPIVNALGLSESITCPSGQDIMNTEIQAQLKDNWNTMQQNHPDNGIRAHMIGGIVTAEFIQELSHGGYLDEFLGADSSDFLKQLSVFFMKFGIAVVTDIAQTYPDFTKFIIKFADFLISADQFFHDDWDNVTKNAVRELLKSTSVRYGTFSIEDDLFIHLDSQLAEGFTNVSRSEKVFFGDNCDYLKTAVNDPPIVHNLEPRDQDNIMTVLTGLTYGNAAPNIRQVFDYDSAGGNHIDIGKGEYVVLDFAPKYSGSYTVSSGSQQTNILVFTDDPAKNLINTEFSGKDGVEATLEAGKSYLVCLHFADANTGGTVAVKAKLRDLAEIDGLDFAFTAGSEYTYQYTPASIGAKRISFFTEAAAFSVKVFCRGEEVSASQNGVLTYGFYSDTVYIIKITNTLQRYITAKLKIDTPTSAVEGQSQSFTAYGFDTYSGFTAHAAGEYTFAFTYKGSVSARVALYKSNLTELNFTLITGAREQIIQAHLQAGETVFVTSRTVDKEETVNAELRVKKFVSEYRWKVNGFDASAYGVYNVKTITRGDSGVSASLWYNDTQLTGNLKTYDGSFVNLSGSSVSVKETAPATMSQNPKYLRVFMTRDADTDYSQPLNLHIWPDNPYFFGQTEVEMSFGLGNIDCIGEENVTYKIKIDNYKGETTYMNYTFGSDQKAAELMLNTAYLYDYFFSGSLSINLSEATYTVGGENIAFDRNGYTNGWFSGVNNTSTNAYFFGGNGKNEAYGISTERQLDSVRKMINKNYPPYFAITANFALKSDITLTKPWVPIATRFDGVFEGNQGGNFYTIKNMTIAPIPGVKVYGFFDTIYLGTVRNLYFSNVSILADGAAEDSLTVGTIAGNNSGIIETCGVTSGVIRCDKYSAHVGGIVGFNYNRGVISSVDARIDIASSAMFIGGIAGGNKNASITGSYFIGGTIQYTYKEDNSRVGGVVGAQDSGAQTNGVNYGNIRYMNATSDSRTLQPCMGQIVGHNEGGSTFMSGSTYEKGTVDTGSLYVVKFGILWLERFDQKLYAGNRACGRND